MNSTPQHALTPRPPLGWNSYDSFAGFINEQRAHENLAVFVERLKPAGYDYFVLDIGWYRRFDLGGREFPTKEDPYEILHDETGLPVSSPTFFPNGIETFADACHAAGVKFGVHLMRGIPRAAVSANTAVKGTPYSARDIADTEDVCAWCPDNYGINMTHPGAQPYYDSLIEKLAGWGIDFIKYDDMVPSIAEVNAVADAIGKVDRDMVLSLSPGNGHNPDGWEAYFRSNLIRISGDIWDNREDFHWVFVSWEQHQDKLAELPGGCWFDQDMIPFGELQIWNTQQGIQMGNILMNGRGSKRMCSLNPEQKRTFMTMRAIGASPLFMGGNLPTTSDEDFALLTHPGMMACNQNGVTGRLLRKDPDSSLWKTQDRDNPHAGWIALFNRNGDETRTHDTRPEALGLPARTILHNVWEGGAVPEKTLLASDDVLFARFEPPHG
jgi:hypothetical protein